MGHRWWVISFLVVCAFGVANHAALAAGEQVWVNTAGGQFAFGGGSFIKTDRQNNILVAGQTDSGYSLMKYGPAGKRHWAANFSLGTEYYTELAAMVVGGRDAAYLTGTATLSEHKSFIATVKYSPEGAQEWQHVFKIGDCGPLTAHDMVIDSQGNIYVLGEFEADFIIIKYNPTGNLLWSQRSGGKEGRSNQPNSIAVDGADNILVSGFGDADLITMKYSSAGNRLWLRRQAPVFSGGIGKSFGHQMNNLAVDKYGNVFAADAFDTMATTSTWQGNFQIVKYDTHGNRRWKKMFTKTDSSTRLSSINVDKSGSLYLAGTLQETSGTGFDEGAIGSNWLILKYGPRGRLIWQKQVGTRWKQSELHMAKVDASGHLIATGTEDKWSTLATKKYDSAGNEIWSRTFLNGYSNDLAFDHRQNVLVTGGKYGRGGILTIKYRP